MPRQPRTLMVIPSRDRVRYLRELIAHLTQRELSLNYRSTVLRVDLASRASAGAVGRPGIRVLQGAEPRGKNYPAFVFSGLIAWSWFSSGLTSAASAVLGNRHFGIRPGFPTAVLPIIAISVALFDAVVALPLLLVLLAVGDDLSPMVLLLPIVFAVQFVLMSGLAWLTASISVFLRDVPNIINVLVLLGFYLTPVYFSVTRVPQQYRWVVQLNPAAILIEADRAYLDWGSDGLRSRPWCRSASAALAWRP